MTDPLRDVAPSVPAAFWQDDALMATFFARLPVAVAYYDRHLVFAWVNPAYAEWTKRAPAEIVGRHFFEVFPGTEATVGNVLRQVLESGEPFHDQKFCFVYQEASGTEQTFWDVAHLPRFDATGQVMGILTIASNLTAEHNLQQEIQERTQALQESESRYRSVFDESVVGIAVLDFEGRFREVNHALQAMLGLGRVALRDRKLDEFLEPADMSFGRLMAWAHEPGERSLEARLRAGDGSVRWGRISLAINRDFRGEPQFATCMIEDVTERKRRDDLLMSQLQRLSELNRLKTDFVSVVTHELRTPLNSILGYAEFLEEEFGGPLSEEQRKFVRQIEMGGRRLDYLISDLLDSARLEAETFQLNCGPTDLVRTLHDIRESLEPQLEAARIRLELRVPPEPLEACVDALRVGQVLFNLLSNAIKFSGRDTTIRLAAERRGAQWYCEVQDEGPGIAADDLPKLFQRFSQLEAGKTRRGTGLGLAISKAIVEAHGGTIGVNSLPGRGSTFWFTLPLD